MNALRPLPVILVILVTNSPGHQAVSLFAERPPNCSTISAPRWTGNAAPQDIQDRRTGMTAALCVPQPTGTATPLPAAVSAVMAQATPVPEENPWSSVTGLRRQGFKPRILLVGDLLLLIVALIILIMESRARPRRR